MIILGINGGFRAGYQDVSAVLVKDGAVLAAVEEERLSRIKFSAGRLPYLSVLQVLKMAGIGMQQVDLVAFHGSTWEPEIETRIQAYFKQHFGCAPPLVRYHHHDCHAASAYYASAFNDALVVTLDNSGDGISTQICTGTNGRLQLIARYERPHSLGVFYSLITQYCGFVKDSDEYKLMGLASYGNRAKFNFDWLIDFKDGGLQLDTGYIVTVPAKAPSLHRDEMNFNEAFLQQLGAPRRIPGTGYGSFYKDVAASAQKHLEDTALKMIGYFARATGKNKICLAGGVALNCVMNQKLMDAPFTEGLFIQPASGDMGISLGAAWLAAAEYGDAPIPTAHTYLGNTFTGEEIESILQQCRLLYEKVPNPAETAASLLAENKVIGWFQGAMEFGPRALGNRSILANATNPQMQDIVNRKIKLRETFRPFCPSVLQEDAPLYFEGNQPIAPYMTVTYHVRPGAKEQIPAVTHIDGTARIQTVNETQNPLYYTLLKKLKEKTGHGVVLNTSFNLSHEPIVATPRDAVATFYASGLDALLIGDFLIVKPG